MSDEQKEFIKSFKKNFAVWLAVQFLVVIVSLVGFYFNTKSTLESHETSIKDNNKQIDLKMDEAAFYRYKEDQNKRLDDILYEVRENRKVIMNQNK